MLFYENSQKASRAAKNVLAGHVFETPALQPLKAGSIPVLHLTWSGLHYRTSL